VNRTPSPLLDVPTPDDSTELAATRAYYDDFARRYDRPRGGRVPAGYHDLVDELELDFLARFATGKRVLEVGCGTGLLLSQMSSFAERASGIDLSEGMLARARARGLEVVQGSATALPFADASFDVACSFKVLAHVRDVRRALGEMVRVVRPGGTVVAEFYNPRSLRALVKRWGPARAISDTTTEAAVYTRFDTPTQVRGYLPAGSAVVASRGVRVVTPAAMALRVPLLGRALRALEWRLCDSRLGTLGGFWIAAIRKAGSAGG
jgi:ubiquinone/menaquinone biosynthesis C-methylase UbiE